MRNFANLCAFQLGWFACALGAAYRHPNVGPLVVAALLVGHVAFARARSGEGRLIVVVAALGAAVDSIHCQVGIVEFHQPLLLGTICPLWMVALWANFATTLHYSLAWLDGRPYLAALFGAVGGPLSFWAGDRWDALSLGREGQVSSSMALLTLAVTWGVVTPLLFWLARRPFLGGDPSAGESPV